MKLTDKQKDYLERFLNGKLTEEERQIYNNYNKYSSELLKQEQEQEQLMAKMGKDESGYKNGASLLCLYLQSMLDIYIDFEKKKVDYIKYQQEYIEQAATQMKYSDYTAEGFSAELDKSKLNLNEVIPKIETLSINEDDLFNSITELFPEFSRENLTQIRKIFSDYKEFINAHHNDKEYNTQSLFAPYQRSKYTISPNEAKKILEKKLQKIVIREAVAQKDWQIKCREIIAKLDSFLDIAHKREILSLPFFLQENYDETQLPENDLYNYQKMIYIHINFFTARVYPILR